MRTWALLLCLRPHRQHLLCINSDPVSRGSVDLCPSVWACGFGLILLSSAQQRGYINPPSGPKMGGTVMPSTVPSPAFPSCPGTLQFPLWPLIFSQSSPVTLAFLVSPLGGVSVHGSFKAVLWSISPSVRLSEPGGPASQDSSARRVDVNTDGRVSAKEMQRWIMEKTAEHFQEAVAESKVHFRAVDPDGDGTPTLPLPCCLPGEARAWWGGSGPGGSERHRGPHRCSPSARPPGGWGAGLSLLLPPCPQGTRAPHACPASTRLLLNTFLTCQSALSGHVSWDEYKVKFLVSKGHNEKEVAKKIRNEEELRLDEESECSGLCGPALGAGGAN